MSRRGRPGPYDDGDAYRPDEAEAGGSEAQPGQSRLIPEGLRRVLTQGAQALLGSEENVRERIGEMRLPKEAISYLLQQTERTRGDLFGIATKEVRRMLRTADLSGELRRTLLGLKVRVRAEITFEEATPKVRLRSRIVRRDDAPDDAGAGPQGQGDRARASAGHPAAAEAGSAGAGPSLGGAVGEDAPAAQRRARRRPPIDLKQG